MTARRPFRREPLAVVLVVVNLFLGGLLLHRRLHPGPKDLLPPGHPDVSVPAELARAAGR